MILFPFMDPHNGLHGLDRKSPQPLQTIGAILFTVVSQHSQIHRKMCIFRIGPLGCRGLLRWRGLMLMPSTKKKILLHLHLIIPWYIFPFYFISLLFDARMDLDLSLRCSHKLDHEAQMWDFNSFLFFRQNPIKWDSVTKPLEFILPNRVLKRLFTCTIEFFPSTQSKDCHQALSGNEFFGKRGRTFFFPPQ